MKVYGARMGSVGKIALSAAAWDWPAGCIALQRFKAFTAKLNHPWIEPVDLRRNFIIEPDAAINPLLRLSAVT